MPITLSITGMTGHHCANALSRALQAVGGVEKVSVSLDSALARVQEKAEASALIRAVQKEGYMAQVASLK